MFANPSVDVPLRHWSYDAVEKLAIVGLCDIADIGVRPVSRIKMAYIIRSAIDIAREYEGEFDWAEQEYLEEILYILIEEFREELVTIGVEVVSVREDGPKKHIFGSPELNVKKLYAKLESDKTLFVNREGRSLDDGLNIWLSLTSWVKVANFFALSVTPGIRYSDEDTDYDFYDGHIRFAHPAFNMELALGRASMWWGPGFYGSLLMTDNAFPMDSVRWNNIHPFRLPWPLRKIGRFNALFFTAKLEDDREVPGPFVTGWRLDYTPWGFLKFGFGHILMHGGEGVKDLGFANFWSSASLVFSAAGGGTETENHIIAGDIQLFIRRIDRWLPIATGAKLYAEWGGEDEEGNKPINISTLVGAYVTDVFKIPGFDGKIEFAKLDEIWYSHFTYKSGYTHKGRYIGHHIGGDSEAIAVSGIFNYPERYKLAGTLAHERRGLSSANVETLDRFRGEFNVIDALNMYNIKHVDVNLFFEMQHITNYNNTTDKITNHILGVEINRKF